MRIFYADNSIKSFEVHGLMSDFLLFILYFYEGSEAVPGSI